MKKLSIEEKARRYNEALEKAKNWYVDAQIDFKKSLETLFPELKESEDWNIRKGLIAFLKENHETGRADETWSLTDIERWIAWLEKQGEQKSIDNLTPQEAMDIAVAKCFDEQKPDDKVEPKFHEGEWVVNKLGDSWHIDSFDKKNYQVSDGKGNYNYFPISKQDEMRLWTIRDARDGDVLACESGWTCIFKTLVNNETFSSYCFMDNTKWFCETGSECHTLNEEFVKAYNGKIYPATKEQHDLLFQKMKKAGYEWNFEKKELKKIEQNPIIKMKTPEESLGISSEEYNKIIDECVYGDDKSTWGKEDEQILNAAILHIKNENYNYYGGYSSEYIMQWLKSLKDRVQPQPKQEWSEEDEKKMIIKICQNLYDYPRIKSPFDDESFNEAQKEVQFIKSLRPQNRWKPSDEQMNALHNLNLTGNISYAGQGQVLIELYNDLKKLKE